MDLVVALRSGTSVPFITNRAHPIIRDAVNNLLAHNSLHEAWVLDYMCSVRRPGEQYLLEHVLLAVVMVFKKELVRSDKTQID